ncbi:MAG: sterol-binding protein [Pseudomonadota bacterium]
MKKLILALAITSLPAVASADFMDAAWAKKACDMWNGNGTLTGKLAGDEWAANNGGRGYKVIQVYRTECGAGSKVQLNIEDKGGKAMCTYGGKPDGKALNDDFDYVMHASDKNWTCIGKGEFGCGPKMAMGTFKLKFSGPKMEAMSVIGPFEQFLLLTGKVGGAKNPCK